MANGCLDIQYTEPELQKMSDSDKLNILVKCILPITKTLYGNGEEGLVKKVTRHDITLKFFSWGLIVVIPIIATVFLYHIFSAPK